jgi:hypothetical protein
MGDTARVTLVGGGGPGLKTEISVILIIPLLEELVLVQMASVPAN